jgi:tripartite-type tricarboxylate transporter receptor subunit TctC
MLHALSRIVAYFALALVIGVVPALASYPDRPVRIVTQGAAGSGPDVIARIVADQLARMWGSGVAVVNQSGGGGLIAAQTAAAAEADGYTLYLPTVTSFVILPEMHERLPVDLGRQFVPVGLVAELPLVVAVAPSLGVGTMRELIDRAKAKTGEIFYAANNRGSLPHLTGERLRRQADIELSFVPYPGAAAGLQDLMGGRVQMIIESAGALAGAIKSGAVKPIGVAAPQRLPSLPDVPTVAETLPGFAAIGWLALMAPAGTPKPVLNKIEADLAAILKNVEVRQKIENLGAAIRVLSPAETAQFIKAEETAWRPLVRQLGLKSQ